MGLGLVLFGTASASTKGILIKLALERGVAIETMMAWRMLSSAPFFLIGGLWLWLLQRRRPSVERRPGSARLVLAAIGLGILSTYLASFLDFSALRFISAQLDRLLLLTYPFFVVLIASAMRRRLPAPIALAALVVSYLGISLIVFHDVSMPEPGLVMIGTSLALGSALLYAIFQIYAKPVIDRMGAWAFNSIAMIAPVPVILVHFALTNPISNLAVPADVLPLMLGIGIFATVIPSYCVAIGISLVGSEQTAIVGNISPTITIGLAVMILGETFTIFHAAGATLTIMGIIVFTRVTSRAKPLASTPTPPAP